MSIGFMTVSAVSLTWLPHGTIPPANPVLEAHNDAVGAFDMGGTQLITTAMNGGTVDSFLIGGSALSSPLPANSFFGRLCYSLQFTLPTFNGNVTNGFAIDNIFSPPAYCWMFVEVVSNYAPTYQGHTNIGECDPSAAAVYFNIVGIQNGDVNCDGQRNVTDIVYMISYVFGGGPAPCGN